MNNCNDIVQIIMRSSLIGLGQHVKQLKNSLYATWVLLLLLLLLVLQLQQSKEFRVS